MNLFCTGIDHKSMSVDVRERLSFAGDDLSLMLEFFSLHRSFEEMAILSTCNRVEFYFATKLPRPKALKELKESVEDFLEIKDSGLDRAYVHENLEATSHLFEVCSGLHSMVIGETEIFGQAKAAYQKAKDAGCCARILNKLFQSAFSAAKEARSRTNIGRGNISVASVAVHAAERLVGNLWEKNVLVLGAGEVGEQVTKALAEKGVSKVYCSSRRNERSLDLASHFGMQSVNWEDWQSHLEETDIIVSSTAAPHSILGPADLAPLQARFAQRPIFIMDLAVPRDVDPAVGQIAGVCLFNVDNLKEIASENLASRWQERNNCLDLLAPMSGKLMDYFYNHSILSPSEPNGHTIS